MKRRYRKRKQQYKKSTSKKIAIALCIIALILITGFVLYYIYSDMHKEVVAPEEITQEEPVYVIEDATLRMGAWNIQVFGQAKAGNPQVMGTIENVIATFDLLAIQEVRDSSGVALEALQNILPANYSMQDSERLGRSSSKEQYTFIWDTRDMELIKAEVYPDSEDVFEREPYMALFEIKGDSVQFVAIVCHIKPSDAYYEIESLRTVVDYAIAKYGTDNIIVMGDLNADCAYYQNEGQDLSGMVWKIGDYFDTTVAKGTDCAYDRIIISKSFSNNFTYSSMVRYDIEFGLTNQQALEVSDHYPVFTEYILTQEAQDN